MHLHQVRYFLALCEEHSFTRAARRCGVAQPSLTRAIKLLEEELGGTLFDRDHQGARLTDLGILVQSDLAQIEQSVAVAKRKAKKFLTVRSATHRHRAMEAFMRAHHVIAVFAVLIVGLGAKQFLFSFTPAEANLHTVSNVATMQMLHIDPKNIDKLPVQKMHDMSFVYSESN